MSGFVVTTPTLSVNDQGDARLYMRVGQHHYLRNEDGTFSQTEPSFHDLVMHRKSAEKAAGLFQKGDRFVAEGFIQTFTSVEADGQEAQREAFVARRIGHDAALTNYQVDRTPRQTPSQAQAVDGPMIAQGPDNPNTAVAAAPFHAGPHVVHV